MCKIELFLDGRAPWTLALLIELSITILGMIAISYRRRSKLLNLRDP